mgnify:CR=1 FL=1
MSFIGICICLIIGLLELIIGVITKMKWLKIVASIPLIVSIANIVLLLGMAIH